MLHQIDMQNTKDRACSIWLWIQHVASRVLSELEDAKEKQVGEESPMFHQHWLHPGSTKSSVHTEDKCYWWKALGKVGPHLIVELEMPVEKRTNT